MRSPVGLRGLGHAPAAEGRRGGYSLLLFGMLVFAFMAIAALSIDIGNATLTRVNMQNATDFAALEGLRNRDLYKLDLDDPGGPGDDDDQAQNELARRMRVRRAATAVFDDDADLATLNTQVRLGAGILLSVDRADFNLATEWTFDSNEVYEPREDPASGRIGLQPNTNNYTYGDMIAGTYNRDPDVPHDERSAYCVVGLANPYCRQDFVPAPPEQSHRADSFLVRMRRTRDPHGVDREPGVSSSGPALPFIYAWASTLGREQLAQGIDLHATSIATVRPAMKVSRTNPETGLAMLAPFVIRRSRWADSFPPETEVRVEIVGESLDADPVDDIFFVRLCEDTNNDGDCDSVGPEVGIVVDTNHTCKSWNRIGWRLQIGCRDLTGDGDCDDPEDDQIYANPFFDGSSTSTLATATNDLVRFSESDYLFPMRVYVPIMEFDDGNPAMAPLVGRTIGFGEITVRSLGNGQYTIRKRAATVDPVHTSVAGVGGFSLSAVNSGCPFQIPLGLDAQTLDLLFRANQNGDVDGDGVADNVLPDAALAPVLVR